MTDSNDRTISISIERTFLNVLLVYLMLFTSGSWRYKISPDKFLVVGFLISFLAWFLFSDRRISDRFLLYMACFTGLLFAISLYTGGSLSLVSVIASTMNIVMAYFIIKTVGERFVDTYVNVIVFLAVFSLFGYLSDTFNLFDGIVRKLPRVSDMGYEGILYLYRFPWHMERNNSIFFEPGAYQAFLNGGLFLLFFLKTGFTTKKKWVYIVILIVTLITTFSTAGFLILWVMFAMFLYRSKLLTVSGKIKIVALAVAVISIFAAQFHSTVLVKLSDYLTADERDTGGSAEVRSLHAKTDLKLFREHVFGIGYEEYNQAFTRSAKIEGASSNGVTKMLAVYGLPFSLFIFGSYYWALKRVLKEYLLVIAAFIMIIMFLSSEAAYMFAPINLAIIASAFMSQRMSPKDVTRLK